MKLLQHTLGKYIFFQHLSHNAPPVSTLTHLPSSIFFSHRKQVLVLRAFSLRAAGDSSSDLWSLVVLARAGNFGGLFSGE